MADTTITLSKYDMRTLRKLRDLPTDLHSELLAFEATMRAELEEHGVTCTQFYVVLHRLFMSDKKVSEMIWQTFLEEEKKESALLPWLVAPITNVIASATKMSASPVPPPFLPTIKPVATGATSFALPPKPASAGKPVNPQGVNRSAKDGLAHEEKVQKFTLCVGDWKCACCGRWNCRWHSHCRGHNAYKDKPCDQWHPSQVMPNIIQEEAPGVEFRKSRARYKDDWLCGMRECGLWNRWYFDWCRCGSDALNAEFVDKEGDLEDPPDRRQHHGGGYSTNESDWTRMHLAAQNRNYTAKAKPWAHQKTYGMKQQ